MISRLRLDRLRLAISAITSARPSTMSSDPDDVLGRRTNESAINSNVDLKRRGEIGAVLVGHGGGRNRCARQVNAFLLEILRHDFDDSEHAPFLGRDLQHDFAVVDEERRPWRANSGFLYAADRRAPVAGSGKSRSRRRPRRGEGRRRRPRNAPSLSSAAGRTRMPIRRPVSSSTSRIIADLFFRIPSCEAWPMSMRKTSAPAANRAAIVGGRPMRDRGWRRPRRGGDGSGIGVPRQAPRSPPCSSAWNTRTDSAVQGSPGRSA